MSLAVSRSPANQDRPLLHPSPLPSDHHHQRGSRREGRMRTLLDLLTIEKMDGLDHHRTTIMTMPSNGASSRWRILRERLGFNAVGCCGVATWRHNNDYEDSVAGDIDDDDNRNDSGFEEAVAREAESPAREGMNLAAALAAERELRAVGENVVDSPLATPSRVSLMRLLEETAVEEEVAVTVVGGGGEVNTNSSNNSDSVCCVCMGRKKGAAFIPCGHTYCRVCSRELWLNRGSCPLCNRRILEILDIF